MTNESPNRSELSLKALGRIDKACVEYEQQLKAGEIPRIETFVAIANAVERRQLIKELLILDLDYRYRSDEQLNQEDYVRALPDDASLIQKTFQQFETSNYNPAQRRQNREARLPQGDVETDFADYKILEEIARGGMGIVYRARQKSLNRIVALKMILHGKLANQEEVQRFQKEAKAAGALDHPGIVAIHEIGVDQNQHYFSMAFVDGPSLEKFTADNPLRARAAAALFLKIVEAVAYAHDHGVVHRDLKPSNILVDTNGDPQITDFGLAKDISADTLLTKTGQVMGTPAFMSPEQAFGRVDVVGPTSDIYSIGAIIYRVLTGRPPFIGASPFEIVRQVREVSPAKLRSLDKRISRELELICLKCLEKDPQQRYVDAHELKEDLNRYLKGEAVRVASRNPVKRVGGQLRYNLDQEQFQGWGLAFIVFGIVIFVAHLVTTWLLLAGVEGALWYWVPRVGEAAVLLVLLYVFHPQIFPRNPNERVLSSLFIGYWLATFFIAVTLQVSDLDLLLVYPFSSVCAAVCFSVLGARFWGSNFWIAAAFFLMAPALPLSVWSPAAYGSLWLAAALTNGIKYWGAPVR
jgi:tRNA A-37 threonylcarbamoyl transferase component Bud32